MDNLTKLDLVLWQLEKRLELSEPSRAFLITAFRNIKNGFPPLKALGEMPRSRIEQRNELIVTYSKTLPPELEIWHRAELVHREIMKCSQNRRSSELIKAASKLHKLPSSVIHVYRIIKNS